MVRASTTAEYERRLTRVDQAIEEQLDNTPSPVDLAKIAAFAPHHFHRIFRAQRGESVMQRVRRLRLTRAAKALSYSKKTILEIALDAGYNSHEAFTRAFSDQFEKTPRDYRATPSSRLSEWRAQLSDAPLPKVVIKNFDATRVISLRHHGAYGEVGQTFYQLTMWAQANNLWPRDLAGLCPDDPDLVEEGKLRMDACVVLGPGDLRPGDVVPDFGALPLVERTIAGARYAVLLHRGTYARLNATYLELIGRWLPTTNEFPTDAPILERYLNDPSNTAVDDLETEVCLPLQ